MFLEPSLANGVLRCITFPLLVHVSLSHAWHLRSQPLVKIDVCLFGIVYTLERRGLEAGTCVKDVIITPIRGEGNSVELPVTNTHNSWDVFDTALSLSLYSSNNTFPHTSSLLWGFILLRTWHYLRSVFSRVTKTSPNKDWIAWNYIPETPDYFFQSFNLNSLLSHLQVFIRHSSIYVYI